MGHYKDLGEVESGRKLYLNKSTVATTFEGEYKDY